MLRSGVFQMTIATASKRLGCDFSINRQSGVALLQILLLSAIISILAIRFTHTARDNIKIAEDLDGRVHARLAAHSAINEVIFYQLSGEIQAQQNSSARLSSGWRVGAASINLFGEPVIWQSNVWVTIQDLNGLLPQRYPHHPAWSKVLTSFGITDVEMKRYLGIWKDIQDPDLRSWIIGDTEPLALSSGQPYLNGFAQNNQVLKWLFSDKPSLESELLGYSAVHSPYDFNPLNAPRPLLIDLLGYELASAISAARNTSKPNIALRQLLPAEYMVEPFRFYNSGYQKIDVTVNLDGSRWQERRTILLSPSSKVPVKVLVND